MRTDTAQQVRLRGAYEPAGTCSRVRAAPCSGMLERTGRILAKVSFLRRKTNITQAPGQDTPRCDSRWAPHFLQWGRACGRVGNRGNVGDAQRGPRFIERAKFSPCPRRAPGSRRAQRITEVSVRTPSRRGTQSRLRRPSWHARCGDRCVRCAGTGSRHSEFDSYYRITHTHTYISYITFPPTSDAGVHTSGYIVSRVAPAVLLLNRALELFLL